MKKNQQSFSVLVSFIVLTLLPQSLRANSNVDLNNCLQLIQKVWGSLDQKVLKGKTRHQTDCRLEMEIQSDRLILMAEGEPLEVNFQLGKLEGWSQSLQSCKADKEKLHVVFEQKSLDSFERKEKVQMTLLKRKNNGLSLILSEKQLKVFMPTHQANLICHLQPAGQTTEVPSP
ncbi:MAG: hypothetical protein ACK5W9_08570 [Bdellovibrionales bacterium]